MQLLAEHEQFAKVCSVGVLKVLIAVKKTRNLSFRVMKQLYVEHKMLVIDL